MPFWRRRTIRTQMCDEARIHSKARNFGERVPWNTHWGGEETPHGVIVNAYR
jgi:hypothetical protein